MSEKVKGGICNDRITGKYQKARGGVEISRDVFDCLCLYDHIPAQCICRKYPGRQK